MRHSRGSHEHATHKCSQRCREITLPAANPVGNERQVKHPARIGHAALAPICWLLVPAHNYDAQERFVTQEQQFCVHAAPSVGPLRAAGCTVTRRGVHWRIRNERVLSSCKRPNDASEAAIISDRPALTVHFLLANHEETCRDREHLARIATLADEAGAFDDPAEAEARFHSWSERTT